MYARAFLEGRLDEEHLVNFRQELAAGGGLSSYPHPWLMPGFWEFPTVSMGLGPIMAIYQARFNKYLHDRGIRDTSGQHVWAFLGDGETDEPESLGAITLAGREKLDNLIFVINCNLQRLDGPVRGNGKIIQELEGVFRGAGWNVIKVIWGDSWDPLLAKDKHGLLVKRMGEVVDGEYQKYTVMPGDYIREHFFGKYPELLQMVRALSDEDLQEAAPRRPRPGEGLCRLQGRRRMPGQADGDPGQDDQGLRPGRSGRRPQRHAPAKEAGRERAARIPQPLRHSDLGRGGRQGAVLSAGRRQRGDSIPEERAARRWAASCPARSTQPVNSEMPRVDDYQRVPRRQRRTRSLDHDGLRRLSDQAAQGQEGRQVHRADRARRIAHLRHGGLFRQCGIYSHAGQLYEPVDAGMLTYYREAKDGQMLEEGITEAGSMSSFIAAGTAYSTHGINMIPFFIYYSMFGFQRIGDLIWAACDSARQGLHDRRHRRPHHAGRRRLAASGRPKPAQRLGLPHRAGLRSGLRLRDDA